MLTIDKLQEIVKEKNIPGDTPICVLSDTGEFLTMDMAYLTNACSTPVFIRIGPDDKLLMLLKPCDCKVPLNKQEVLTTKLN